MELTKEKILNSVTKESIINFVRLFDIFDEDEEIKLNIFKKKTIDSFSKSIIARVCNNIGMTIDLEIQQIIDFIGTITIKFKIYGIEKEIYSTEYWNRLMYDLYGKDFYQEAYKQNLMGIDYLVDLKYKEYSDKPWPVKEAWLTFHLTPEIKEYLSEPIYELISAKEDSISQCHYSIISQREKYEILKNMKDSLKKEQKQEGVQRKLKK